MKVTIIIPVHNEAKNISKTLNDLESKLNVEHIIIVVDDHSSDDTKEIVKEHAKHNANVYLIENNANLGFANAIRTGIDNVSTELFIPVMADLCDDSSTINEMYKKIEEGYDVVCGSRYMKGGKKIGGPFLKTFFSRFVGNTLHLLIGIPTRDIANSFKMYRKEVLKNINLKSKGFEISVEICLSAFFNRYKITEVPTIWNDRKEGESKFNVLKMAPGYLRLYFWAIFKYFL